MAEIEYFTDPEDKSHSGFKDVKNIKAHMYSRDDQMAGKLSGAEMTLGEAFEKVGPVQCSRWSESSYSVTLVSTSDL